ncbi:MAG: indole-3-glycerol phosphate synthase TrpC [Flavobacteriaceae bacterium]|nr:indole-3-glycerol phosphate synthase TrpC [Flavobacteriaceae bacterium]
MNILSTIIAHKKAMVQETKALNPVKRLENSIFFNSQTVSFKRYIKREDKVGIIAEIKRASPSKGCIKSKIDVEKLSIGYMQHGASALSVLTDSKFFGGKNEDLSIARKFNCFPILRKDFIIDEYQILEAKSIGADCILLIADCLSPQQCKHLAAFAKGLGLEVLLEVHSKENIETHTNQYIDAIGVNNRDLKTFTTNIAHSKNLYEHLPKALVKISESGITKASQILELKEVGFDGFLIGSFFMQHDQPEIACKQLINNYLKLKR